MESPASRSQVTKRGHRRVVSAPRLIGINCSTTPCGNEVQIKEDNVPTETKDDTGLITFYNNRIEKCKGFAARSLESPKEIDPGLPMDEWVKLRNEATWGETCFTHLAEEFQIMKPRYLGVGYSEATVDFIEGEIKRAIEEFRKKAAG